MRNLLIIGANGTRVILGGPGVPAPEATVCALGLYDPADSEAGAMAQLTLKDVRQIGIWIAANFPELLVDPLDRTLSIREAARRLGVHENTVRNMMTDGRLESRSVPGSKFRRPLASAVHAMALRVEERRREPEAPAKGG